MNVTLFSSVFLTLFVFTGIAKENGDSSMAAAPINSAVVDTVQKPEESADSTDRNSTPDPIEKKKSPSDSNTAEPVKKDSIQPATSPVDSTTDGKLQKEPQPEAQIHSSSSILEESEEELILDGGEESIIPAAAEAVSKITSSADSQSTDSQKVISPASADSSSMGIDSTSGKQQEEPVFHYPASAMPKIPEEPPQPMRVEEMKSINFAKNYKEYRSIKVAMLLSLLVPGTGQAYAHNMLKTGIFGAVEVGLITAGAIVGFNGKKKWDNAHHYADDHYSTESFTEYYKNLKDNNNSDIDSQLFTTYVSVDTFYLDAREKNQDYYNYISHVVSPYIQGWKDVCPRFDANFDPINDTNYVYFANEDEDSIYLVYRIDKNGDTSLAQYGFSKYQEEYNDRLSKANTFYRWSKSLFTILILNHIASAIDAGITAKAYNDKLLGKKSFWQKLNIRETYVGTPLGPANGFALEVRF